METGNPYMLFKDACNGKSNQQNLGTIKRQPVHGDCGVHQQGAETAVCNMAAITHFPGSSSGEIGCGGGTAGQEARGFPLQHTHTGTLTAHTHRGHHPGRDQPEQDHRCELQPRGDREEPNMSRSRPLRYRRPGARGRSSSWVCPSTPQRPQSSTLEIFETIYYAVTRPPWRPPRPFLNLLRGQPRLSRESCSSDMWGVTPSDKHDWDQLRRDIAQHGVRNSGAPGIWHHLSRRRPPPRSSATTSASTLPTPATSTPGVGAESRRVRGRHDQFLLSDLVEMKM